MIALLSTHQVCISNYAFLLWMVHIWITASRAECIWLACNHSLYDDLLKTTRFLKEKSYDKLQLSVKTSHKKELSFHCSYENPQQKQVFKRKKKDELNLEIWEFAALEVDFNNNKAFIVDAKHRFKETSTTERLLEHKITGGRQVMEIILRGRCLRCASKLIAHPTRASIYSFITSRYLVNKTMKAVWSLSLLFSSSQAHFC